MSLRICIRLEEPDHASKSCEIQVPNSLQEKSVKDLLQSAVAYFNSDNNGLNLDLNNIHLVTIDERNINFNDIIKDVLENNGNYFVKIGPFVHRPKYKLIDAETKEFDIFFSRNCVLSGDKLCEVIESRVESLLHDNPSNIRFIKFEEFVSFGSFSHYPDNIELTCPLNSIDRDSSLLIFISHSWNGLSHPDSEDNEKFKLCVSGIEKIKHSYASRVTNCYIWLDFSCLRQDDIQDLEVYGDIMQCCDIVFTPIVDNEHESWDFPSSIQNIFIDYKAKSWNDGQYAYLNRAWCRLEINYCDYIPLLENKNSVERFTLFDGHLAYNLSEGRRTHFLFGTKEFVSNGSPHCLPSYRLLPDNYPLNGNVSVASDMKLIQFLFIQLFPIMSNKNKNLKQLPRDIKIHYENNFSMSVQIPYTWEDRSVKSIVALFVSSYSKNTKNELDVENLHLEDKDGNLLYSDDVLKHIIVDKGEYYVKNGANYRNFNNDTNQNLVKPITIYLLIELPGYEPKSTSVQIVDYTSRDTVKTILGQFVSDYNKLCPNCKLDLNNIHIETLIGMKLFSDEIVADAFIDETRYFIKLGAHNKFTQCNANEDEVLHRALTAQRNIRIKLSKIGVKKFDEYTQELRNVENIKEVKFNALSNMMNEKIRELIEQYPAPPIRFISLEDFIACGSLPRYPEKKIIVVPLESINREESLLIFISHCWMRPKSGTPTKDWDGRPHPDNENADKFSLCVAGIQKIKKIFASKMKNCYIWLDYGCLDQDNKSQLKDELERYDKVMENCDVMFTPIVDHDYDKWSFPMYSTNFLESYKADLWNGGTHAYLHRGWCRVEMLYAANIPVLENTNTQVKRYTMFDSVLGFHCSQNRRPHFLYGYKEVSSGKPPVCLPPLQHTWLDKYHPLKGTLSLESDIEHIKTLLDDLQPYIKANPVNVGYVGERNEQGEKHGQGIEHFDNGSSYKGEFRNDCCHGRGILLSIDGTIYDGDFHSDLRHGYGMCLLPDGSRYEGEWSQSLRHGHGVYSYTEGDVYEGNWLNNMKHGHGIIRYADGKLFEGEWKDNTRNGYGTLKYVDGSTEIFQGEWKDNVKHGHGIMKYCNGDSYEGEWVDDLKDGPGIFRFRNGSEIKAIFKADEIIQSIWQPMEVFIYLESENILGGKINIPGNCLATKTIQDVLREFITGVKMINTVDVTAIHLIDNQGKKVFSDDVCNVLQHNGKYYIALGRYCKREVEIIDEKSTKRKSVDSSKIRFINLEDIVNVGSFPIEDITCPLTSIDRDNSLLVCISHCGIQSDGKLSPDNADNDKYRLCVSGITSIKQKYAPRMKNCYIWFDYLCYNQDCNVGLSDELRYSVIECCDVMFTPIIDDDHRSWKWPTIIRNFYLDYQAKSWNSGPNAYLNRAWCRVDMLCAASIPVLQNTTTEYKRHTMFDNVLDFHCSQNRRPHFLYGTKELQDSMSPRCLPPFQKFYLNQFPPLQGSMDFPSDVERIKSFLAEVDTCKLHIRYEGERNENGDYHGRGVYYLACGSIYEGEFQNGEMFGSGVRRGIDGSVYSGQWAGNNNMNGYGVYKYNHGDVYEGNWVNNQKIGQGIMRYSDGSMYDGEWNHSIRHGQGKYSFASGNVFHGEFKNIEANNDIIIYEGEWKNDQWCGQGVLRLPNGNVFEGKFVNGRIENWGTLTYANGDVYEGQWVGDYRHGHGTMKYSNGEVFKGEWNLNKVK